MRNTILVPAVVAFVVAVFGTIVFGTGETITQRVIEQPLGLSQAEISNFDAVSVKEFTQGGGVLNVAPSDTTTTLTQAQLGDYNVIAVTASSTSAAQTWTLPATSTMTTLLPDAGDCRSWVFKNENTTAATTTTIAAGTGVILLEPDSQNVVIGGGNVAGITMCRDDSTDILAIVDELIDAD